MGSHAKPAGLSALETEPRSSTGNRAAIVRSNSEPIASQGTAGDDGRLARQGTVGDDGRQASQGIAGDNGRRALQQKARTAEQLARATPLQFVAAEPALLRVYIVAASGAAASRTLALNIGAAAVPEVPADPTPDAAPPVATAVPDGAAGGNVPDSGTAAVNAPAEVGKAAGDTATQPDVQAPNPAAAPVSAAGGSQGMDQACQ